MCCNTRCRIILVAIFLSHFHNAVADFASNRYGTNGAGTSESREYNESVTCRRFLRSEISFRRGIDDGCGNQPVSREDRVWRRKTKIIARLEGGHVQILSSRMNIYLARATCRRKEVGVGARTRNYFKFSSQNARNLFAGDIERAGAKHTRAHISNV